MDEIIIGIDVSKQKCDLFDSLYKKHVTFQNNETGIQQIIDKYLNSIPVKVVMESTGVYHRLLHKMLETVGFEVCVANPSKTRFFAKSAGFLAKTDKVDAKMLCEYGTKMTPKATPYPSKVQEELESLLVYKESLEEERKRQINQGEYQHSARMVQSLIKKKIHQLTQDIKSIENRIDELIDEDDNLKKKRELMESIPGVGPKSSAVLLCFLPELGTVNRKTIAALVGVAPMVCESGFMKGRSMIKGGRAFVRKSLYMPILCCITHNSLLKKFYEHLIDHHKPAKVALLACMRKLITILNVMIKNNTTWREKMIDD